MEFVYHIFPLCPVNLKRSVLLYEVLNGDEATSHFAVNSVALLHLDVDLFRSELVDPF